MVWCVCSREMEKGPQHHCTSANRSRTYHDLKTTQQRQVEETEKSERLILDMCSGNKGYPVGPLVCRSTQILCVLTTESANRLPILYSFPS